jgi:tRNA uridine 5-carbamoylmethylation protein Kti12
VDGGKWLSVHEEYVKWSKNAGSDFLWIEGKPGSGKSTLSKRIVQKIREDNSPDNSKDQNTIIAEFYYNFRGGITETSHELMLRSIVYQIWSQNERLFPLLRDRYRELKSGLIMRQ